MLRRLLKQQLQEIAAGRDPIGVSFDAEAAPVSFEAGQLIVEGIEGPPSNGAASRREAALDAPAV